MVDDADYEMVSRFKWYVKREKSGCIYFRTSLPYVDGKRQGNVGMHTLILPPPPGMDVDHGDGNGANNQRYNLAHKTRSQNNRSFRRKSAGTSSKYRGVYWAAGIKRWRASLAYRKKDGKIIKLYLGTHDTEIDAAKTWNECAVQHGFTPEALNVIPE